MCHFKSARASYLHINRNLAFETNSWKDSDVSGGAGAETVTTQTQCKINHEKWKQGYIK